MSTVALPTYDYQPTVSLTSRPYDPPLGHLLEILQFQTKGVTLAATPKWSESFLP